MMVRLPILAMPCLRLRGLWSVRGPMTYDLSGTCLALELARVRHRGRYLDCGEGVCQQVAGFCRPC